ncbi:cob(I)yrinic acid a,c-diamide adenosyltransferase [Aciduricibacillus chroicocephali]|uniref:Corrinoid adenosyltransferase n=1 Tax=Aciduricibacillus chroicocephali TaxID=3054939 RepID=A0ABY9KTI2_9BACI|nr:cob(I)yrinic acid a,c-diamide adenosyltransferase [Bacillaceae bacterium 44XB]
MKLYTKTGDQGETALIGARVAKDNIRVEAYGTIDELNCFVGSAVAELDANHFADLLEDLETIQHELFDAGSDLANVTAKRVLKLSETAVTNLEDRIDTLSEEAPEIERFILPGGTKAAAALHIARTVCRRAERSVVTLINKEKDVPDVPLRYLNRLSDYFFAAARVANSRVDVRDVEYVRSAKVFRNSKKQP